MVDGRVPIVIFESATGNVLDANQMAAEVFKIARESLIGTNVRSLVVSAEESRLLEIFFRREARWGDGGEWICRASDHSRFLARLRFHQAIENGRLIHLVFATEIVPIRQARSAAVGSGPQTTSNCG